MCGLCFHDILKQIGVLSYFNHADHSVSHLCALNAVLISSECRDVEIHTMEGRSVALCEAEIDSSHLEGMWVGESVSCCFLRLLVLADREKHEAVENQRSQGPKF